jgi:hypothetical protein
VNYIPCDVGHKLLQIDCCLFKVTSINYNLYYLKKSDAWFAKQRGQTTTEWPCQKQVGWFSDHIIHLGLTVKYRSDWQYILRFTFYGLQQQTTIAFKGKVFPVHAMKAYIRSRDVASLMLNLSTRWRWLVNFMPWPLYTLGKTPSAH